MRELAQNSPKPTHISDDPLRTVERESCVNKKIVSSKNASYVFFDLSKKEIYVSKVNRFCQTKDFFLKILNRVGHALIDFWIS